jgi:endogenous inhibitor of DNA gyrase (YacG/DUF329 family)
MQCPICKKPVEEGDLNKLGSTFPFCSDRCRLIDLGRWLSGKYQIRASRDEAEASDWDSGPDETPPSSRR